MPIDYENSKAGWKTTPDKVMLNRLKFSNSKEIETKTLKNMKKNIL